MLRRDATCKDSGVVDFHMGGIFTDVTSKPRHVGQGFTEGLRGEQ